MASELNDFESSSRREGVGPPSIRLARLLRGGWAWLLPAMVLYFVFFAVPLGQMLLRSVWSNGFTLEHYIHLFTEDVYRQVFWITIKVSLIVTLVSLIIAYPAAYLLAGLRGRALQLALIFVLLPFWISVLVRNYAWLSILARQGIVNNSLLWLGLIDQPLQLVYNLTGVVIGMTYVLVPFMIFSLYAAMHNIDRVLLRASASLGARPFQTFWRIFFPQTLAGMGAGALLVFITSIGFFITPALLGGGRVPMIATLIESQVRGVLNFGIGSALGAILLVFVLGCYLALGRVLPVGQLLGSAR